MEKIKILFISSNPTDFSKLNLKEEFMGIENELRKSPYEEYFELFQNWETRIDELQDLLLRRKPDILHISGHGSQNSEIVLQNSGGYSSPVSNDALKILFHAFRDSLQCVVLNCCYSELQAQAIAEKIKFVVGVKGQIGDRCAIEFSKSFYRAIAHKKSINEAYKLAQNAIELPLGQINNSTKLHSSADANYSFISRRIQAQKLVKDIEKHAPSVALGYTATRVWDKIRSAPVSNDNGEAAEFTYDTVSELKNIVSTSDLTEEVAEGVFSKIASWFANADDLLF
ncbi:CHAT domain-containing protein [Phaeodactylibacter xiamenensis]|uniref:CHAT domain-containing protein n=1 Tax=Phaeodactylibacter xiamenensis TaxID=1524460 RepID=UPI0024A81DA9|nr:CHAT domain-containing protein [Phaeodactylibacter xiamenensis]